MGVSDLREAGIGVSVRGAADYPGKREDMSWNARLANSRAPELIVSVKDAAQAEQAIRFARAHSLRVSARGGGHSYEAAALRDSGIMLDLGGIDAVEIDSAQRTAWVGAGVRGSHLIELLAEHELAFPIGHCGTVSLSGYILSGGFGWNSGSWGPACANVLAVEAVLADGTVVMIDDDTMPGLMWAARGAGCGFPAIATRYLLALQPLPAAVSTWSASFAAGSAAELAEWLDAATAASPASTEVACLVGPDLDSGEPALSIRAIGFADTQEAASQAISRFCSPPAAAGRLSEPQVEHMRFDDLPKYSAMPAGKRVRADHLWSSGSLGEMMVAIAHLAGVPCKASSVNLFAFGGGASVLPCAAPAALAVGGGNEAGIYAMWDDAEADAVHCDWVTAVDAALAPYRIGRYVGEANLSVASGRVSECFTKADIERIEAIRSQYDPEHLFFSYP